MGPAFARIFTGSISMKEIFCNLYIGFDLSEGPFHATFLRRLKTFFDIKVNILHFFLHVLNAGTSQLAVSMFFLSTDIHLITRSIIDYIISTSGVIRGH